MDSEQYAVVNVEGSYLVKIAALFATREEAEAARDRYLHPFGTFVYPVFGPFVKVGAQYRRHKEYER